MTKDEWVLSIAADMKLIGTYRESYTSAIDTLADILERRDMIMERWRKEKCKLLINKKSDRGAVNKAKNPLISMLEECERSALNYMNQLGLTPSGYKKAVSDAEEAGKKPGLAQLLAEMHA